MAKKTKIENQPADLAKTLSGKRGELRDLAFKSAGSRVLNVRQARALRRDIARALTSANQAVKNTK